MKQYFYVFFKFNITFKIITIYIYIFRFKVLEYFIIYANDRFKWKKSCYKILNCYLH